MNTTNNVTFNGNNNSNVVGNENTVVTGDNNSVTLNKENIANICELLNKLSDEVREKAKTDEERNSFESEVLRILNQLKEEKPKPTIVKHSLNLLRELAIEVTGAAISPPILEKLAWFANSSIQLISTIA